MELAGPWIVILAGLINGFGGALLWTAQGRLMLEIAGGEDMGRIFSIFWSVFNSSAVAGGLFTATFFASSGEADASLFIVFTAIILLGAAGTFCIHPPPRKALYTTTTPQSDSDPSPVPHSPSDTEEGLFLELPALTVSAALVLRVGVQPSTVHVCVCA
jgi:MFS family permease